MPTELQINAAWKAMYNVRYNYHILLSQCKSTPSAVTITQMVGGIPYS